MLIGGRGKRIGEGFIIITILVVVILLIAVITVSVKKEGFLEENNCTCYKGFKKSGTSCNIYEPKTCKGAPAPSPLGVFGHSSCKAGKGTFMMHNPCKCSLTC